jgi:hypothetical protein
MTGWAFLAAGKEIIKISELTKDCETAGSSRRITRFPSGAAFFPGKRVRNDLSDSGTAVARGDARMRSTFATSEGTSPERRCETQPEIRARLPAARLNASNTEAPRRNRS